MLEMDRMLRPGGHAYIRDATPIILQLKEVAEAMGWVTDVRDTSEGPYSNWRILRCDKRL